MKIIPNCDVISHPDHFCKLVIGNMVMINGIRYKITDFTSCGDCDFKKINHTCIRPFICKKNKMNRNSILTPCGLINFKAII